MAEVLRVDGRVFDPEDLTFGEKRAIRHRIQHELWDDADGEFDWELVGENEVMPATVVQFMLRDDSSYTLEQALALKPRDVYGEEDPPTEAVASKPSSRRASAPKKKPASSGTPS